MKKLTLALLALIVCAAVHAQKKSPKNTPSSVADITNLVTKSDAEAHLTFLAADEMRGRNTGSPELEIAANYIASNFRQWGIKPAPGTNDTYFQTVEFQKVTPPSFLEFVVDGQTFKLKEDVIQVGEAMLMSQAELYLWDMDHALILKKRM